MNLATTLRDAAATLDLARDAYTAGDNALDLVYQTTGADDDHDLVRIIAAGATTDADAMLGHTTHPTHVLRHAGMTLRAIADRIEHP